MNFSHLFAQTAKYVQKTSPFCSKTIEEKMRFVEKVFVYWFKQAEQLRTALHAAGMMISTFFNDLDGLWR